MNSHKPVQGMILAAGFGERLKPFTFKRPKPLLEVLGQPLIFYALRQMELAGAQKIVINTHHLGDQIKKQIGASFRGIPITYLYEKEILETGGALKNASALLDSKGTDTLLMNGDTLIDLNFANLQEFHEKKQAVASLVLKTVANPKQFGIIGTDKDELVKTLVNWLAYQGPQLKERMFCGAQLLSPEIFGCFPPDEVFSSVSKLYAPLIQSGKRVAGFDQSGFYRDIGTPEALFTTNMDILDGAIKFSDYDFFERFSSPKPGVWLGNKVVLAKDAHLEGPVVIDDGAIIESRATIGPHAVVGKRCKIGSNAIISQTLMLSDTVLAENANYQSAILDSGLVFFIK